MTGLRYITASGSSCCGFPWSDEQVAGRMARDHVHGATDPVVTILQPSGQAMGQPVSEARRAAIVARATQLVIDGNVPAPATAEELAWLRGEC